MGGFLVYKDTCSRSVQTISLWIMSDPIESLDQRPYRFKWYPELGDFSVSAMASAGSLRDVKGPGSASLDIYPVLVGEQRGVTESLYRHDWRAKSKIGRYCRRNNLDHSVTLTYASAGVPWEAMVLDFRAFMRRLRQHRGGPVAFVAVPELTKSGRYHLQCAIGGFIDQGDLERMWKLGFVWVSYRKPSHGRSSAEQNAAYISKYVAKAIGKTDRPAGANRYFIAQGFQPTFQLRDVWSSSSEAVIGSAVSSGWIGTPTWVHSVEDVPSLLIGRSDPLAA